MLSHWRRQMLVSLFSLRNDVQQLKGMFTPAPVLQRSAWYVVWCCEITSVLRHQSHCTLFFKLTLLKFHTVQWHLIRSCWPPCGGFPCTALGGTPPHTHTPLHGSVVNWPHRRQGVLPYFAVGLHWIRHPLQSHHTCCEQVCSVCRQQVLVKDCRKSAVLKCSNGFKN